MRPSSRVIYPWSDEPIFKSIVCTPSFPRFYQLVHVGLEHEVVGAQGDDLSSSWDDLHRRSGGFICLGILDREYGEVTLVVQDCRIGIKKRVGISVGCVQNVVAFGPASGRSDCIPAPGTFRFVYRKDWRVRVQFNGHTRFMAEALRKFE